MKKNVVKFIIINYVWIKRKSYLLILSCKDFDEYYIPIWNDHFVSI